MRCDWAKLLLLVATITIPGVVFGAPLRDGSLSRGMLSARSADPAGGFLEKLRPGNSKKKSKAPSKPKQVRKVSL